MFSSIKAVVRTLRALCVALVVLAASVPAGAQGTSGQLPDPLSTSDLKRLLSMYVHPTDAEMATIEALHDDYRAQFRTFRESDIEQFLAEMQKLMGTGVPTKAAVQDFTRKYERINTRIAEIDNGFFDAIGTLLGDERQVSVKRARDARARARISMGFLGQMPGVLGGSLPDVAAMAIESKLPASVMAEIQPELISYEERLTGLAREMSSAGVRMMIEMVEALEKAGYANLSEEEMMKDPERMKGMMEAVQAALAAAMKPIMDKAGAVYDTNRRTFRSVHGHLSGDEARKFRLRYVRTAYPEIGSDPASAERLIKLALRIRALDENTRSSIQAAYESWKTSDDALVDEAMKMADESRKDMAELGFNGMATGHMKLAEFSAKRAELGAKALESIKPMLGDERIKKLYERVAMDQGDMFDDTSDPEAADPNAAPPTVSVRAGALESPVANVTGDSGHRRIEIASIRSLIQEIELEEGSMATAEMLHADYEKRWEESIEPYSAKVSEAQAGMWTYDATSGVPGTNAAKRDEYFNLRKEVLAKALELDEGLFRDIAGLAAEGKENLLAAAKLGRLLESNDESASSRWFGNWTESEQSVNIISVIRSSELPAEERLRMLSSIGAKAAELEQAIREARTQALELERDLQIMTERNQALYSSGKEVDPVEAQKTGQEWMRLQSRGGQISAKRSELVRAAWESVLASSDGPVRERLQLEYDKLAYPSIFDDPRAATSLIEKALEMQDLSPEQKQELQILHDRYRAEYLTYCRQMIPSKRVAQPTSGDSAEAREYWKERMAQENANSKVRFDRDERSQRAVSQLRRILSADQAGRIGGLASYDEQFHAESGSQPAIPD